MKQVLVVEDHAIVRAGIRRLLDERGDIEVLEAATGEAALVEITCLVSPFDQVASTLMSSPAPLRISRSPTLMAMSLGSSAYLAGNSHCSFSSFLPSTRGRLGKS